MSDEAQSHWKQLAGRYDLANQPEWRKLLTHFELSDGFALIVLLVLDADGAVLCRHKLEKHLHADAKNLIAIELSAPDDLRQLPAHFLDTPHSPDDACLWVAAVEPDYSKTYPEWRDAWQHALAQLNAYRNPIRERFQLSLIFAGAPWLQEVMREIAPDLWSVRTFVARIEPLPQTLSQRTNQAALSAPELSDNVGGGDPHFSLQEADKLRGISGKELTLADLLHRAGNGFANLQNWHSADSAYSEALELKKRFRAPLTSFLDTLINLGGARLTVGHIHNAITLFQQALEIGRDVGNRLLEANMLGNLASAYLDLGDPKTAIILSNQNLKIVREIGNRRLESDALGIVGNAFLNQSQVRKAIGFFEKELAMSREANNLSGECSAIGNLGRAYASLGDFRKSIEFYERALVIARQIGDRRFENILLGNLGISYRGLGQIQKAIECYEQGLAITRQIGNRKIEDSILGNLGNAYRALGNTQKAIELYEQSLLVAREFGYQVGTGANLANLGIAYLDLGEMRKGLAFLDQSLEIARKIGDKRLEGNNLWNSALALEKLNNQSEAVQRAETAFKIFKSIEDPNAPKVLEQLEKWRGRK